VIWSTHSATLARLFRKEIHMGEKKPQTFANHSRWDPSFHFYVLPILLLGLLLTLVHFFAHITHGDMRDQVHALLLILLALAFVILASKTRMYALKVQDRVIRLEEQLRLTRLLPEPLRSRIPDLTEGQLCALRFASDAELPKLAERALNEKLSRADIKKAIQNWRPDYWRV
jgi:Family of unknown function (DUF6526)